MSEPVSQRLPTLLAPFLCERSVVRRDTPIKNNTFVLYVPCNALRTGENPALDAARSAAASLGLPLVVHAFFDSRSLHATARRATFVLEGLQELRSNFPILCVPLLLLRKYSHFS